MKRILILCMLAFALMCCGCAAKRPQVQLPEALRGQTFLYDELETGEGSALYTLRLTDTGYYLNLDGGAGVVSYGSLEAKPDKSLVFGGDGITSASYTGSSFETPSVTMVYNGRELCFTPASETAEYVYLSYLGTYSGTVAGKDAVFILERWSEWYLYTAGELKRGSYDIFADGTILLRTEKGKELSGSVEGVGESFSISDVCFRIPFGGEESTFSYCEPLETFDALHAMGTYTLSLYPCSVFEIHGADGFLKAFGTLENNIAAYFPRMITNDSESTMNVSVERQQEGWLFPETTPLLPRSGNISEETGFGSYWNAGTSLEFLPHSDVQLPAARDLFAPGQGTGTSNFPESAQALKSVMPTIGEARPLVLLIDFPDQHRPRHVTAQGVKEALFSLDNVDSLSAYYYRSSYGKLTIDGTVLDWYRMKMDRGNYSSDEEIMCEVLEYYISEEGLDLADYDADNDGVVDSLYVLWAGNPDGGNGGMWNSAYRSTWDRSPESWSRSVTGYIFVPGTTIWSSVPPLKCNTNSLIHETGHLLGLNDYYSYDTSAREGYTGGALEGGLGGMDMMDTNTGEHNIYSKWLLGWVEPTVIEYEDISSLNGQTFRLRASALTGDCLLIKLKESKSLHTELFAIEVVSPVLNFAEYSRLKEPVARILHIDSTPDEANLEGNWRGFGFRNDNSYTTTKFISVLEADGKDEILNFVPTDGQKAAYDPQDYFRAGAAITPNSYPNTNAYDALGNASVPTGLCIYVDDIDADGTATIRLSYTEPTKTLQLTGISPEPQAVPYSQSSTVEMDSIRLTFSEALSWAETNAAQKLRLYSDQKRISGLQAEIDGNTLILTLSGGFDPGCAYTLVVPAGILCAGDAPGRSNNFNGIYGFLTAK